MNAKETEDNGGVASELDIVIRTIDRLASTQPQLAGVQSLLAIDQKRLGRGFEDADLEILAGALVLEAERQLQSAPATRRRITKADVKAALSQPINTKPFGHAYFDKILDDAKAQLVSNPRRYRRQLAAAQGSFARQSCLGGTPRWICIGMVVIVIVGIILLL
jgi:hypothetical protein